MIERQTDIQRRLWMQRFLRASAASFALPAAATLLTGGGCMEMPVGQGVADLIYGSNGYSNGQFQKPRAIAIDQNQEIYIVDLTGRIQVFNTDGKYQRHWNTPATANGRPTGLAVGRDGVIWVADTHYFQALAYTPTGELLQDRSVFGVAGIEAGEFGMLTEVAEDAAGRLYISEYGENDRIQVFSPQGEYLYQIGSHGTDEAQFMRPQATAFDDQGQLWVADSGNGRLQVFKVGDDSAELVKIVGEKGHDAGQMRFPYDLFFDEDQNVFVCEFGNHRVQKLAPDGTPLWLWSSPQAGPASLYQPWGCVIDAKKRLHILDSYHHRVYRVQS